MIKTQRRGKFHWAQSTKGSKAVPVGSLWALWAMSTGKTRERIIGKMFAHCSCNFGYRWLVGGLEHLDYFPYIGNNTPIWVILFRGVETTNQMMLNIPKIERVCFQEARSEWQSWSPRWFMKSCFIQCLQTLSDVDVPDGQAYGWDDNENEQIMMRIIKRRTMTMILIPNWPAHTFQWGWLSPKKTRKGQWHTAMFVDVLTCSDLFFLGRLLRPGRLLSAGLEHCEGWIKTASERLVANNSGIMW